MRIIIWYNEESKERAEERFNQIMQDYAFLDKEIVQYIKTRDRASVVFLNGDCLELIPLTINSRGKRASISYYPLEEINNEWHYCLINAFTIAKPHFGIILY